jgi:hypothetical protein
MRRLGANQEEHAARADGTYALRFVHIADDGSARELDPNEVEYLNTEFHPADSGRPYIKSSYSALTPDGRMRGFLARAMLPPEVAVPIVDALPVLTPEEAIEVARETFRTIAGLEGPFVAVLLHGIWHVTGKNRIGDTFVVKVSETGRVAFGGLA